MFTQRKEGKKNHRWLNFSGKKIPLLQFALTAWSKIQKLENNSTFFNKKKQTWQKNLKKG